MYKENCKGKMVKEDHRPGGLSEMQVGKVLKIGRKREGKQGKPMIH